MKEQDRKERKIKIVIRGLKMKNSEAKKKVEEFMEEDFNIKDGISGVETRGRGEECNITIVEMKDWGTKQTGKANGKEEETGRKKSVHRS